MGGRLQEHGCGRRAGRPRRAVAAKRAGRSRSGCAPATRRPRRPGCGCAALLEWADGPLEDAQLLLSELVTNSLRHAGLAPGDELEVVVRRPPPALRVMVIDPGVGFVPPAEPSLPPPSQATGRGLYIVSRIADRWGVSCGERTCVWFEIDGPRRLEHYHLTAGRGPCRAPLVAFRARPRGRSRRDPRPDRPSVLRPPAGGARPPPCARAARRPARP